MKNNSENTPDDAVVIDSDQTLVALCLEGDEQAQFRFYDRFHPRVAQTLHEFTKRSPTNHEDLVQITFIQLFRKLHTFKGDSMLGTWVYRVARNQGLMYLRDFRTRAAQLTSSGDEALRPLEAARLDSPARVADRIGVEQAFKELPRGYRAALYLHDVLGLEHTEVASLMGWREGTSKSQLHKARVKMRKMINRKESIKRKLPAAAESAI